MRTRKISFFLAAALISVFGVTVTPCAETDPGLNLAVVASPASSYVSGDTTLEALNDGHDPRSSQDRSHQSYGNWPRRGTEWVEYEWGQPISTSSIDVYWWNDRRGVRNPKACRVLYWDGERFVPVSNAKGLGVEESQYNTSTFDEVETSKLRLEIDSSETYSTGILEWKVYDSGKSPDFPPTVSAGVDRVVMLGGPTYLTGAVKTLARREAPPPLVTWSHESGPGEVTFEDPRALETKATFTKPGAHVLRLTARRGDLGGSSTLRVLVKTRPPAEHLELIDTRHYKVESAFWSPRVKAIITSWIPHCIARISEPELREGGINNFVEAAKKLSGEPHGPHRGYVFSNAWVYNTIESICVALMVDPAGDKDIAAAQDSMKATLESWIPKILAAQEPDGYIQTAFTLSERSRWSPRYRADHEGYVAGYLLEAAIAHYLVTDRKDARLYTAAKKLADCWDRHIGPPPKQEWWDGHQAMEIALVRFGRFVNQVEGDARGDRYIALAKFLLDCRGDGDEYDQSHVPVIRQYEAVGHAVRAVYSYAGMADVAMETGDVDYQSAVASLWDNIVNRKYYVTGGVGSGETSEGFGPDYSLRHNAYCESCSSCGEIFFQHKLNLAYHESMYADLYEETLYNALLGSLDLEAKNFYYQNPLEARGPRYPWHGCPCCVGNIPRTLLMLPTWTYLKSDDSIYVNLFVGSTMTIRDIAGTDVELIQATDYPWSGGVSLVVNPAKEKTFSLKIRVPNRAISDLYQAAPESNGIDSIAVNGVVATPRITNGYADITRTWKAGDKVELVLPMQIQRVRGLDKIEATRGQVALRRGPILYSVESVDQDIDGILEPTSELRSAWEPDLLGGVVVIRSKWADGSPLLAIPNYARNNREPEGAGRNRGRRGAMSSVWIAEQATDER